MAMNKQRRTSNISNIFSYDDAGNIVIKDYSQVVRYSWNGTLHGFIGQLSVSSVSAAVTDTDKFLVSDGGVLKYRTGAEVLSDIGGQPVLTNPVTGTGATGQVAYWNGANSQTGSNNLFWDAANARLGIGTNAPAQKLSVNGNISFGLYGLLIENSGLQINQTAFYDITFKTNNTTRATIFAGGNFQIGSPTSDGGQRLQVYGDAFIKGSGSTSATNALLVQNSAGTQLAQFRNDQYIQIGSTTSSIQLGSFINFGAVQLYPVNNGNYAVAANATELRFDTTFSGATTGDFGYLFGTYSAHNTSHNDPKSVIIFGSFSPTSGAKTFTNLLFNPTINQTGGANGITRGLYINPTLTAAADWRSIEWSNNSGWGLYGAGTSNNYLAGSLGIGTTALTGVNLYVVKAISGSTISTGIYQSGSVQSGVTTFAFGFNNSAILAASTTLSNYYHYSTDQSTFGAGATLGNQVGFFASGAMTSATNNYGFRGGLTNGTGRWNLYMDGTADNYLAGKLLINTTTVGTFNLDVNGTARVSGNTSIDNGYIYVKESGGGDLYIRSGFGTNTDPCIQVATNDPLLFATFSTVRGQFFANGNFHFQNGGTFTDIASARLAVNSTTQGFLPPRMTTTQKNAIATPAAGLIVYNNTDNYLSLHNGTNWQNIVSPNSAGNVLIGTVIDGGQKLQVNGTSNFSNTLSVITTATTNDVALFKSTEPYITIEAAGASNSASIFLKPSTSAINATIQNRTGGGIEFYTGATPSISATIKSTGAVVVSSTLGLNGVEDSVKSGKYTPTLTNGTNVASSAVNTNTFKYVRVGNTVNVSGWLSLTATSANTLTELEISLPIASNITSDEDVSGVANTLSGGYGQIRDNATNNTAKMYIQPTSTSNLVWYMEFSYVII